jgi:hypothetical protein
LSFASLEIISHRCPLSRSRVMQAISAAAWSQHQGMLVR